MTGFDSVIRTESESTDDFIDRVMKAQDDAKFDNVRTVRHNIRRNRRNTLKSPR